MPCLLREMSAINTTHLPKRQGVSDEQCHSFTEIYYLTQKRRTLRNLPKSPSCRLLLRFPRS